jgi:hypothetical protein
MVNLVINGTGYQVGDLGSNLNKALFLFFDSFINGTVFDEITFRQQVGQYFDFNKGDLPAHDKYFNSFSSLWSSLLQKKDFTHAEMVWQWALDPVLRWEKEKAQRAHKGTPFYFWAVTALLAGDVDRGFMLMHRALREDELSTGQKIPDKPGNAFVTLDYEKQDQYFRGKVEEIARFLDQFVSTYRQTRTRSLQLKDLQVKFLSNANLRASALFFVYLVHKLESLLRHIQAGLAKSDFAGLLELDILFGFCLATDSIIKCKYANPKAQFSELAVFLLKTNGSLLDARALGKINGEFRDDFGTAVCNVVAGSISGLSLGPLEADVALCYGIRNRAAHNIEGHTYVYENFEMIVQRVLNALFVSVETLY